jgi:hypothetical protein
MRTFKRGNLDRAARAGLIVLAVWSTALLPLCAGCSDRPACGDLVGSYVTTFSDREEVFSSRGLMTFTSDGILLVSDSSQGGVPDVWDPFSTSQGIWKCLSEDGGKLNVRAIALNFVLPADGRSPFFARVDYKASLETKTGKLSGSATLRFTSDEDLEGADPIGNPGPPADQFNFIGERVVIKE